MGRERHDGLYGFRKNSKDKITLNYKEDCGPECFGRKVLCFCLRNFALDLVFDRICIVQGDDVPTQQEADWCIRHGYCDRSASRTNWYELLRNLAGDLDRLWYDALSAGKVYITDDSEDITYATCEYAYIINLDTGNLEFWVGKQETPQPGNRYGEERDYYGHYPSCLAAEYPNKDIVAGGPLGIDGYIRQMEAAEKEKKVNAAS